MVNSWMRDQDGLMLWQTTSIIFPRKNTGISLSSLRVRTLKEAINIIKIEFPRCDYLQCPKFLVRICYGDGWEFWKVKIHIVGSRLGWQKLFRINFTFPLIKKKTFWTLISLLLIILTRSPFVTLYSIFFHIFLCHLI